jgi:hypothetical protein
MVQSMLRKTANRCSASRRWLSMLGDTPSRCQYGKNPDRYIICFVIFLTSFLTVRDTTSSRALRAPPHQSNHAVCAIASSSPLTVRALSGSTELLNRLGNCGY